MSVQGQAANKHQRCCIINFNLHMSNTNTLCFGEKNTLDWDIFTPLHEKLHRFFSFYAYQVFQEPFTPPATAFDTADTVLTVCLFIYSPFYSIKINKYKIYLHSYIIYTFVVYILYLNLTFFSGKTNNCASERI